MIRSASLFAMLTLGAPAFAQGLHPPSVPPTTAPIAEEEAVEPLEPVEPVWVAEPARPYALLIPLEQLPLPPLDALERIDALERSAHHDKVVGGTLIGLAGAFALVGASMLMHSNWFVSDYGYAGHRNAAASTDDGNNAVIWGTMVIFSLAMLVPGVSLYIAGQDEADNAARLRRWCVGSRCAPGIDPGGVALRF